MHCPLEAIPPDVEFDGMVISHSRMPRGFDLDALLQGLPDDLCPCPHWGYVFQGRMLVRYADGSEEEIKAGDVYYLRAGHTAVLEEDSVSIDLSPVEAWQQLTKHLAAKMQAV